MSLAINTVKMTSGTINLKLDSPYHPDLPPKLRQLGGKWNADRRAWYLPADVEASLRQVCVEIFGIDPLAAAPADLVNAEIDITGFASGEQTLYAFGRSLLHRPGRDANVRPGDGVSILRGSFKPTGGSARYPALGAAGGETVLLVRDVPRAALEQFQADHGYAITIVDKPSDDVAFVQAKEYAVQFGQRLAKLTDEQKQEIFKILETAMKGA